MWGNPYIATPDRHYNLISGYPISEYMYDKHKSGTDRNLETKIASDIPGIVIVSIPMEVPITDYSKYAFKACNGEYADICNYYCHINCNWKVLEHTECAVLNGKPRKEILIGVAAADGLIPQMYKVVPFKNAACIAAGIMRKYKIPYNDAFIKFAGVPEGGPKYILQRKKAFRKFVRNFYKDMEGRYINNI